MQDLLLYVQSGPLIDEFEFTVLWGTLHVNWAVP